MKAQCEWQDCPTLGTASKVLVLNQVRTRKSSLYFAIL